MPDATSITYGFNCDQIDALLNNVTDLEGASLVFHAVDPSQGSLVLTMETNNNPGVFLGGGYLCCPGTRPPGTGASSYHAGDPLANGIQFIGSHVAEISIDCYQDQRAQFRNAEVLEIDLPSGFETGTPIPPGSNWRLKGTGGILIWSFDPTSMVACCPGTRPWP